jgi:hypothetical protein
MGLLRKCCYRVIYFSVRVVNYGDDPMLRDCRAVGGPLLVVLTPATTHGTIAPGVACSSTRSGRGRDGVVPSITGNPPGNAPQWGRFVSGHEIEIEIYPL